MKAHHDQKNLLLAFVLSALIIFVWQVVYAIPQREAMLRQQAELRAKAQATAAQEVKTSVSPAESSESAAVPAAPAPTVAISSGTVHGTISTRGLRFEKLTLTKYRTTLDPNSPEVVLLSSAPETLYFADFGWLSGSGAPTPGENTIWEADTTSLAPGKPVNFRWDNGQGLRFTVSVTLDEAYLFTITRTVENYGTSAASVQPFGRVNRTWTEHKGNTAIIHEGALGAFNDTLEEVTYHDMMEDEPFKAQNTTGWLGMSDKYWLTAIIPQGPMNVSFGHYTKDDKNRFQADYLGAAQEVQPGNRIEFTERFFAGPKELKLLDGYATTLNIPLFDRAVDLGVLYFLTKPIFETLLFFFGLLGNFGLAILLLTVCIKALLFPLAQKSFIALNAMKELSPQITKIREQYGDDKVKMNQELMALYQREKVNPMAGCLPILIQIPIFFALYKVLSVTIEMRHAPFYGWIHDLSAPDPTNIFTLFGAIDWNPPLFLHIGIWPIIMFLTMVVQMKLNPKPTDPVQEKVMTFMPWLFLFMFSGFPAGLIIYWSWSNSLSILQQLAISKLHKRSTGKATTRKAATAKR